MRRRTRSRGLPVAFLWLLAAGPIACDGTQTVSLTAEDFRFVPDFVLVSAGTSLTISVYNAAEPPSAASTGKADGPGIMLPPGRSLRIRVALPPGTYLYICRRKGHANMTGTLVVE
jgi:plastocyanin